jgi:hypothetical protein
MSSLVVILLLQFFLSKRKVEKNLEGHSLNSQSVVQKSPINPIVLFSEAFAREQLPMGRHPAFNANEACFSDWN